MSPTWAYLVESSMKCVPRHVWALVLHLEDGQSVDCMNFIDAESLLDKIVAGNAF